MTRSAGPISPPEIWGGIECTLNRVHDRQFSQLERNGHLERIEEDLAAFEALGLDALRYPVLWEHVEQSDGTLDFRHADRALAVLEHSAMRPIVGLLHHGSGPPSTSLDDPLLPDRFAQYALAVARRYPWVMDFTPINEPLTTARFAGLYGHWYPHAHDDRAFVTMLLTQARATILGMRAIRVVNPSARLVQTEDLGQAAGTRPTAEQVQFENTRRWLTFDLLTGAVTADHPLYGYLTIDGAADPRLLEWIAQNPCPPDVVGINHYPRSNRWLDHRLELYPAAHHGGNGRIRYADVAASDTAAATAPIFSSLIEQAWHRYGIPIALTEVHVHDTPPGQVAWWQTALDATRGALAAGADVTAVTTWSLLGSFDWDTLCTSEHDDVTYEPGAFHLSAGGQPCETPLAVAVRDAARRTRLAA